MDGSFVDYAELANGLGNGNLVVKGSCNPMGYNDEVSHNQGIEKELSSVDAW